MSDRSKKLVWAGAILLALLAANVFVRWPSKAVGGFGPPAPREIDAGMRARIDEAIEALPEEQRADARHQADETAAFFESVKNLPEAERVEKVREHFRENPMPFLRPPGPPAEGGQAGGPPGAPGAGGGPGGGPGGAPGAPRGAGGGPGGPGSGHIPPPEERYSMDQHIATEQEKEKAP